jgi:hypothetical protein
MSRDIFTPLRIGLEGQVLAEELWKRAEAVEQEGREERDVTLEAGQDLAGFVEGTPAIHVLAEMGAA